MENCKTEGSIEPGGARFGNFINYYQFNPAEERICHLPQDLFSDLFPSGGHLYALDVGCNAGNLTVALHRRYSTDQVKLTILGADIDELLIKRAQESLKNNNASGKNINSDNIDKIDNSCDTDNTDNNIKDEILSKNTENTDESTIKPVSDIKDLSKNGDIEFVHADIMSDKGINKVKDFLESHGVQKFDMIFLFSVSMWIHLHHGDEGLEKLLEICSKLSRYTLLEPQPWKCYQTATRRMRRNGLPEFPHWTQIKLRGAELYPATIELARKYKMEVVKHFGETKWKRQLILLKSNQE